MISTLDYVATPIPIWSVLLAILFTTFGVAVLVSALRSSLRGQIRVPIRMMDTSFGRFCISLWCFGVAAVGFARAFHWSALVLHENLVCALGFGSLVLALAYGYLTLRRAQHGR